MRSHFWRGIFLGSLAAAVLGAIVKPFVRPRKKPLVERGAEAIKDTTRELMHGAKRVRRRIMKRR